MRTLGFPGVSRRFPARRQGYVGATYTARDMVSWTIYILSGTRPPNPFGCGWGQEHNKDAGSGSCPSFAGALCEKNVHLDRAKLLSELH